jgi:hypothetical protein
MAAAVVLTHMIRVPTIPVPLRSLLISSVVVRLRNRLLLLCKRFVGIERIDERLDGLDFFLELVWAHHVQGVLLECGALSRSEVVHTHGVNPASNRCQLVANEDRERGAQLHHLFGVEVVPVFQGPNLMQKKVHWACEVSDSFLNRAELGIMGLLS